MWQRSDWARRMPCRLRLVGLGGRFVRTVSPRDARGFLSGACLCGTWIRIDGASSENRDLARTALDRAKATRVEQPAIDAAAVEGFAQELTRKLSNGEVEARKAWLSAIVDAIIVEYGKIRIIGRNGNFETTCEASPSGAAIFAVLIGSGGGSSFTTVGRFQQLRSRCGRFCGL